MKFRQPLFAIIFAMLALAVLPAAGLAESRMPPRDFPLLEAIKKDDLKTVKSILKNMSADSARREVNGRGHTGDTPLAVAAWRGNLEIVKLLVEHGADVNAGKDRGKRTPLLEAAAEGHADVVEYLIAKGADVNAGGNGITPLLAASSWGRLSSTSTGDRTKTVHILLEKGADINAQDASWLKTGRTPLMYAVMMGDAAMVQEFLARGARLDLKDKDGDTALALAEKDGLEYIASLLTKAAKGESLPLSDLSDNPLFKAVREGRPDKVKAALAQGADVNVRMPSGSTPLMMAADGNHPEIVKTLLMHGADVNAKNGRNNTALIFAAVKGHAGVVRELLGKKADVRVKNIGRNDALIYAVTGRKKEVVELLLVHGASVTEKYIDEKTALMVAASDGSADIAKLLIAHKADVNAADKDDVTALMIACERSDAGLAEALLKAGADMKRKSKYGDTALGKAIAAKNAAIVKTLVKSGAAFDRRDAVFSAVIAGSPEIVDLLMTKDFDVNTRGFAGGTLLMLAADGDTALVKYLIGRGADVNLQDDEGKTALMKATGSYRTSNLANIRYLIAHGANVNAVNNQGETALIIATKKGNSEMVKVLLEKGSSVSIKTKEGKTAWTCAIEGSYPAVVSLLEKAGANRDYLNMEWKGNGSKQKEPFIKGVETSKEWSELWLRAFEKPAPDMDFEKYVVACIFLGHQADWLYSIVIGQPVLRDNQLVIEYGLIEVMLRLSGPFRAGGQYHMQVFEKVQGKKIVLEETGPGPRKKKTK